ncbi:MAG: ABC transporter substrate-binding protein [Pseudomonadota bacterium]
MSACNSQQNEPYPSHERGQNIYYAAFTERPKHLDPAQSYTEDEITFTAQIYEPPLQYHYLKRPYTLIPATASALPVVRYYDAAERPLADDAPLESIAYSVYDLHIKPGIYYAEHPAFALDAQAQPRYQALTAEQLKGIERPADFAQQGTHELQADDYLYQIKRLAHPGLHSPIFGMMAERIVGLKELGEALQTARKALPSGAWLDLDQFALSGVTRIDRYHYRIKIRGKYPQFMYWLAMPFFAPLPRAVDRFYSQAALIEKNLTLDQYPVGTGPFALTQNDPNSRIVLSRNPNFHGEQYPCTGEAEDLAAGLLDDCGQALPFIEQAVFSRERESIPYWSKFLQGYYDASGISSDSFDQAIRLNLEGDVQLSEDMRAKNIRLLTSVRPSTYYMGFNMLDPVVGGLSEQAKQLRQALSIAVDQEEFISIFMNGRGVPAMSPIPPGIFGYQDPSASTPVINPVVYELHEGQVRRKPIALAKALLAKAGWPNGRHHKSGEPLVLNLDTTSAGMGDKSRLDWLTRQFAKLDIQLVVRSTDFNRFQEKIRKGAVQLYYLGWNADYPDPENFFFLLNSAESKVKQGGENTSNYANPEFDRLFAQLKDKDSSGQQGRERLALIQQATHLLQKDAPWIFGFHPKSYTLGHAWLYNRKPTDVGNNILKYQRIDVAERARQRQAWNHPVLWPLALALVLISAVFLLTWRYYRRRERSQDLAG